MTIQESRISDLTMQVEINAPRSEVWALLTDNIGDWWPAEFYAGGEPDTRGFSLEAKPGGLMMENWGSGGGVLWGTVVGIEPNELLQVLGSIFPAWGGPNQWFGTWELSASGDKTTLKFSEHAVGRVSDAGVEEKDKGWRFLWSVLKARAEGQPAPAWGDA